MHAQRQIEAATAWLRGLIDVERRPDWPYSRFSLAPIRALLERLGHPERALPAVHIAGSKGKGSTALLTETILLGNIALRTGKKLDWDGPNMKARNCPEAEQFIRREYRKGYTL